MIGSEDEGEGARLFDRPAEPNQPQFFLLFQFGLSLVEMLNAKICFACSTAVQLNYQFKSYSSKLKLIQFKKKNPTRHTPHLPIINTQIMSTLFKI